MTCHAHTYMYPANCKMSISLKNELLLKKDKNLQQTIIMCIAMFKLYKKAYNIIDDCTRVNIAASPGVTFRNYIKSIVPFRFT